jgi:hypothetical protein
MAPKSRINWLRGIALAGLCWSLLLQAFMVQASAIEIVTADAQPVLCHNVADEEPADDDKGLARCHLCWLPGASTVLLSDAAPAISKPVAVAAPLHSFYVARFSIVTPPPRGASRAPPSFA